MQSQKEELYRFADGLRLYYYIPDNRPIKALDLVSHDPRIDLEYCHFKTPGLCGVAMVGDKTDTLILNSNRNSVEQNFDCSHELVHLFKHRSIQDDFKCFTKARPRQNTFLEWQANEGAAQFLVPYQDFIPRFTHCIDYPSLSTYPILDLLADFYNVTPQVINVRISSLSYEIDQYQQGIAVDNIKLLSRNQQRQLGIRPTPYSAVCDFSFAWDAVI